MLRWLGRTCYVLSLASIGLSLGTQWRMSTTKSKVNWLTRGKPSDSGSERMSIFYGLWAPTFAIAGKIFEDMGREQEMTTMNPSFGTTSVSNGYNQTAEQAMSSLSR